MIVSAGSAGRWVSSSQPQHPAQEGLLESSSLHISVFVLTVYWLIGPKSPFLQNDIESFPQFTCNKRGQLGYWLFPTVSPAKIGAARFVLGVAEDQQP